MREKLVDWIVGIHLSHELHPETQFLTMSLIDRYLDQVLIMRTELNLLAVSAMLIATKYEEVKAFKVEDLIKFTNNAYTAEQIRQTELSILIKLQFSIKTPSPYTFLKHFATVAEADQKLFHLALYLIEISLIEQKMLAYKPSLLAASALFLASKNIKKSKTVWTDDLIEHTTYTEAFLRDCAYEMCILITRIDVFSNVL